jgi:hypothetical protein
MPEQPAPTLGEVLISLKDRLEQLSVGAGASTDWSRAYVAFFGANTPYLRFLASRPEPALIEQIHNSQVMANCQAFLAKLRDRKYQQPVEKTQVITVRLPAGVHGALKDEAWTLRTSLNKLCLSKLLSPVSMPSVISGATGKLEATPAA